MVAIISIAKTSIWLWLYISNLQIVCVMLAINLCHRKPTVMVY